MPTQAQYQEYLKIIADPDHIQKIAKLEFLNDDNTVAFALDNQYKKGYGGHHDSRAFLQDGTLNVSLQNGQRRKCSIVLENLDGAFDYNVNNLWFGQKIRLLMGVKLSDGSNFYLPQGVFYIDSPQIEWKPSSRKASYSLVDKWAYLDGSLFGYLQNSYLVDTDLVNNIFYAMQQVLRMSRFTLQTTGNKLHMIDNVQPVFTDYYNNRTQTYNGEIYPLTALPYDISVDSGKALADILTELNDILAGWIGYDATGALTVTPSDDDIGDQTKPVLWDFTTESKTFLGLSETTKISGVYNDIIVYGESTDSSTTIPEAHAINDDAKSDTAVSRIGRKCYIESQSNYHTDEQCQALAKFRLKSYATLQKSVTITSTQMFHLKENELVTVRRSDKSGSPIERHLIQSFSLPIAQNKSMSITATSVMDYPDITLE